MLQNLPVNWLRPQRREFGEERVNVNKFFFGKIPEIGYPEMIELRDQSPYQG